MKNLQIPKLTKEEAKIAWDNIKPNDKLIKIEEIGWGGEYYFTTVKVVRKTPKGSIRLSNNDLLKDYYFGSYYIINEDLIDFMKKANLEKELMSMLYKIECNQRQFKKDLEYEDLLNLHEILKNILEKNKSIK